MPHTGQAIMALSSAELGKNRMRNTDSTIIVVDDDPNDLVLIERAFRFAGANCPIHTLNGLEVIAYMRAEGRFSDRDFYATPSFILMDLKMPGVDGFTVLKHLKSKPEWALIAVVVFSGSRNPEDSEKALQLGANAFHVKPTSLVDLRLQVKVLHDYWMTSEMAEIPA